MVLGAGTRDPAWSEDKGTESAVPVGFQVLVPAEGSSWPDEAVAPSLQWPFPWEWRDSLWQNMSVD